MTIQTAVLIETLIELGAKVNGLHVTFFQLKIMRLQLLLIGDCCICKKGETLDEYWQYTHYILDWGSVLQI